MIEFILIREGSTAVETMGRLKAIKKNGSSITDKKDRLVFHTVEQEWRPTAPGGEPFNSCIPEGRYKLRLHKRAKGETVLALVNPGLGVYYKDSHRLNKVGRYLCLIHSGNTHADVTGCIAIGLGRSGQTVTSSRKAVKQLMEYVGDEDVELFITQKLSVIWPNG